MLPRLEIRARQIRALYQRELTALHRNESLSEETMRAQVQRLWHQTVEELQRLQRLAESEAGELPAARATAFQLPAPPPEIAEISFAVPAADS